ncbi:hypothetical protein ACHAP5_010318 [Fusarium lateritium]
MYSNIDGLFRPPSAASEASDEWSSFSGNSLGCVSQRTLNTAANLKDGQIQEQFRRTRDDYYHDRGQLTLSTSTIDQSLRAREALYFFASPQNTTPSEEIIQKYIHGLARLQALAVRTPEDPDEPSWKTPGFLRKL